MIDIRHFLTDLIQIWYRGLILGANSPLALRFLDFLLSLSCLYLHFSASEAQLRSPILGSATILGRPAISEGLRFQEGQLSREGQRS